MATPTTPNSRTTSSTSTATVGSTQSTPSPVPPPVPVETHPNRGAFKPPGNRLGSEQNHLTAEEQYKNLSPPRLRPLTQINGSVAISAAAALRPAVAALRVPPAVPPVAARLAEEKRNRRRRQKPYEWKKLLWIKQHGYPDNYTDTKTFLDHLQRNPRLRPYDFWPLVADSSVIVQHVCSVAIFICAYAGIYQDRLSPVAVVTCGTVATVFGWVLWDHWIGQEEAEEKLALFNPKRGSIEISDTSSASSVGYTMPPVTNVAASNGSATAKPGSRRGLGLSLSTSNLAAKDKEQKLSSKHAQSLSRSSFQSISPIDSLAEGPTEPFPRIHLSPADRSYSSPAFYFRHSPTTLPQSISPQNQARLKTFKSALLIYFTLLGLSPILKSLTKSTSSDSIWALAVWLLIINIFFFDYGSVHIPNRNRHHKQKPSGHTSSSNTTNPSTEITESASQPKTVLTTASTANTPTEPSLAPNNSMWINTPPFPSSLSTNAALMASTVLASRLLTTTAVFSLTLFSIQVFGLFPVFRRHLRHRSSALHFLLTFTLVSISTASLNLVTSQSYTHRYGDCGYCLGWILHVVLRSVVGIVVGGLSVLFVMGGCTWWLIGLQRYKNVVIGPWDPAKPVLAGGVYGRSRTGTD